MSESASADVPAIFDGRLLTLRRQRARKLAATTSERADFLLTMAEEDIADRVSLIRRDFTSALVLGGHAEQLLALVLAQPEMKRVCVVDTMMPCQPTDPRVALAQVATLEDLKLPDQQFDLIVSPLMLQWVNDLPGVLLQLRRALKPDGVLIANLIGGRSLTELRDGLLRGETEITAGASPRVHPMIDVRELGGLLQRAMFALPVADTETLSVTYTHPIGLMRDLRAMGATNILTQQRRNFLRRDVFLASMAAYQRGWTGAKGRVSASFEMLTITGWAPHETQQKPLKPGSAQQRLADALKPRDNGIG